MKSIFPLQVCNLENIYRSSNSLLPIHKSNVNPYESGKAAILDMILLSKTNLLLRTSSNLSLWSTYMSPDLPVIELNKRHTHVNWY